MNYFILLIVIGCSQNTGLCWKFLKPLNYFYQSSVDLANHPNLHMVNPGNCGLPLTESRIIGGSDAELGQFPWIVQIFMKSSGITPPAFECGGTIINTKFVLSAGHCISDEAEVSFLRIGEFNVLTNPDCDKFSLICAPPYQDYYPSKIIRHERFNQPNSLDNDISLIRVKGKIQFNDFVKPICLPYGPSLRDKYNVGNIVEVAGWGATIQIQTSKGVKNKPSPVLQKIHLPIIDKFTCAEEIESIINDGQLCAGGSEGLDTCAGDSGGPVMKYTTMNNRTYRYFLLGLVSYGPTICGQNSIPGVYTKLDYYINWILDHIY